MKRPEFARVIATLVERLLSITTAFLRPDAQVACLTYLLDKINPTRIVSTKHGSISFFCSSSETYNASIMKEKRTLDWIDSFDDSDILYDVGAHAGSYTLYAARRNIFVYAFEPAASTYSTLVRNIQLNGFSDLVSSFNVALNDKTLVDMLHMEDILPGRCGHTFAEFAQELKEQENTQFAYRQTSLGYSLDDFVEKFDIKEPNHIKIDVDGNEDKILSGALNTISKPTVKSIAVELYQAWRQGSYNDRVIKTLSDHKFQLVDEVKTGSGVPGNHLFVRH
jgi:FkbM family methyltransferase